MVQIGLIASERQAINACMRSLAAEDEHFQPLADKYWVARGGSHTDGGAFCFSLTPHLTCTNKFGAPVTLTTGQRHLQPSQADPQRVREEFRREWLAQSVRAYDNGGAATLWQRLQPQMKWATWDEVVWGLDWLRAFAANGDDEWSFTLQSFNLLRDRRYDPGDKKRASLLTLIDAALRGLFAAAPLLDHGKGQQAIARSNWETRHTLRPPQQGETTLILDVLAFPPEGEDCAARWLARAVEMGWRQLIAYNWRGGRFAACGLGPDSAGARVDLYGDVGDYAASGLDGAEVHLHDDGQDQFGQILKRGKLVIYGDVGQTFLYGAKGGEIFVLGSAAGRPLINAVGRPRAIINGTCLDYLAESFMAGDPLQGGGFVILNGLTFDESGQMRALDTPYPGGNLFSLASGGAIYLRDPHRCVLEDQLNGGVFTHLTSADWQLIEPYLQENERLFGIRLVDLLTVNGSPLSPAQVYRKVEVRASHVLQEAVE